MATESAELIEDTLWRLDPVHSSVELSGKHMGVALVKGRFTEVQGTIVGDLGSPSTAEIEVEIDAVSIDTGSPQRDAHLRSRDFLDVRHFPTISFRSSYIEALGQDNFWVRGALSVRQVTRDVNFVGTIQGRATNHLGQEVIGISAETSITPSDFGLNWNLPLPGGAWLIGDHVRIELQIEAIHQD